MQLAWLNYAHENRDGLVPNWTMFPTWPDEYRDSYSLTNSWIVGTAWNNNSTAGIRQGALWPYTKTEGIYRCPGDKSLWPCGNGLAPRPFNLSLSVYVNGGYNGVNGTLLVSNSGAAWSIGSASNRRCIGLSSSKYASARRLIPS